MSPEHVEKVAADVDNIEAAWENMGCTMPSPFMTMGLLSLACIPSLRLALPIVHPRLGLRPSVP